MIHVHIPDAPDFTFLVVFAVILVGPLVIRRFKVPGIIGMLIGGLLIGPHVFGFLGSGETTIPNLGNFGLLYLMFMAGLELDLKLVMAHRRDTLLYAAFTFTLPMGLGMLVARALGFGWMASVLLGSLLASHTLIVYPTIKEMGRGDNRAVTTGVGATVVTDTLTLIVLAVVQGLTTSSHESTGAIVLQIVVGMAVLGVGAFVVLPLLARFFLGRYGTARPTRYVFALVAMLGIASLGDAFGIDGIIGAFFAGLALNQVVPNEGDLMERLDFFGGAFFVPVFLVSVGLRIIPSVMIQPETLQMAAWFIVACFAGKGLASLLTRPLLRYGWPEVGILFSLTIPQAAATLAAAQIGYDIGLFSNTVLNAILVLIAVSLVLSAVITPIFTRRLEARTSDDYQPGKRVLLVISGLPGAPAGSRTGRAPGQVRRRGGDPCRDRERFGHGAGSQPTGGRTVAHRSWRGSSDCDGDGRQPGRSSASLGPLVPCHFRRGRRCHWHAARPARLAGHHPAGPVRRSGHRRVQARRRAVHLRHRWFLAVRHSRASGPGQRRHVGDVRPHGAGGRQRSTRDRWAGRHRGADAGTGLTLDLPVLFPWCIRSALPVTDQSVRCTSSSSRSKSGPRNNSTARSYFSSPHVQ